MRIDDLINSAEASLDLAEASMDCGEVDADYLYPEAMYRLEESKAASLLAIAHALRSIQQNGVMVERP